MLSVETLAGGAGNVKARIDWLRVRHLRTLGNVHGGWDRMTQSKKLGHSLRKQYNQYNKPFILCEISDNIVARVALHV